MKLQLFLKNNLALHLYYSKESVEDGENLSVDRLYLIVPGFPQFTHRSFFEDKVSKDVAFFYLHYYGSWFSGGEFTFKNAQKSIRDAIDFIKKGIGEKTFDGKGFMWDYKSLSLIGSSFGGSPIVTSNLSKRDIERVILLFPFVIVHRDDVEKYMSKDEEERFWESNKNSLAFMRRGYPNVYRGVNNSSWDDYFLGRDANSKVTITSTFPPVEVIHGEQDTSINPRLSKKLEQEYSQVTTNIISGCGHDFYKLFKKIKDL